MRQQVRGALLVGVPVTAAVWTIAVAPWTAGVTALWILLGAAVLEAFPAEVSEDAKASLAPVASMLGLLLGGPTLAVAGALGSAAVVVARTSRQDLRRKAPYNVGMLLLSQLTGAYVFVWATAGQGLSTTGATDVSWWIAALVLSWVTHWLVNVLLLASVVWAVGGPPVHVTSVQLLRDGWWAQPFTALEAAFAYVVLVEVGAAALVLLLVPVVVSRRAYLGFQSQRESLDRSVRALVRLVEVKDEYTRGHAERVAELSDRVAARMGLSAEQRYWIRIGAVLHDVGKVGVPLEVLTKAGRLDDGEYWEMRRHPDVGADLLETVDALAPAVPLVRQHHERIDGCGYPRGLKGDEVPLETRIVSAVDSWDAMTTTRPYRTALPEEVAIAELRAHAGTQFDAEVVAALIAEVAPDALPHTGTARVVVAVREAATT